MRRLTFFLALFGWGVQLRAQSVLQDKSGAGTIALGVNQVAFNAGDASVTGGIGSADTKVGKNTFWDVNIKFKSTDGTSGVFDGSKLKPTVDISFDRGWGRDLHSFYYGAKLSTSFFNLVKSDNSNTFADRSFVGPTLTFGYNLISAVAGTKKALPLLFGASANVGLINNLKDLKSVDIYQTTAVTQNDTTKTLLQDKKSGFLGDYHTSGALLINFDFFVFPSAIGGQVGIGGYGRIQAFGYKPRQTAGLGFIIGQKGAPANIAFGLLYQFNDVFDNLGKESEFFKRGGINLVAGYKF